MPLLTEMQADIATGSAEGQTLTVKQNQARELLVAQGLPPGARHTMNGARWGTRITTPIAPIVVFPTTLANLEVKNNHDTKYMFVDTIYVWQLLGTAATQVHTPWAQVGAAVQSSITGLVVANTGDPTLTYTSAAGKDALTAITQTVVANGWECFPGGTAVFATAAATPGGAVVSEVGGRLVVPPGKALHVAATGSLATASSIIVGATWYLV